MRRASRLVLAAVLAAAGPAAAAQSSLQGGGPLQLGPPDGGPAAAADAPAVPAVAAPVPQTAPSALPQRAPSRPVPPAREAAGMATAAGDSAGPPSPPSDDAAAAEPADAPALAPADLAAGLPPVFEPAPADLPPPGIAGTAEEPADADADAGDPDAAVLVPPPSSSRDVTTGLPPVFEPAPADLPPPPMLFDGGWAPPDGAALSPVAPPVLADRPPPSGPPPVADAAADVIAVDDTFEAVHAAAGAMSTAQSGIRALLERLAAGEGETADPPPPAVDAGPLPAATAGGAPVRLVRQLQQLQDQMAAGSIAALRRQRVLLDEIEAEFAAAPRETWTNPANAHALVTFVLSGGNPAPLRTVLDHPPLPPVDERLMRGVLAYADGREEQAALLLADVDVFAVPPSMGAQLALAKAALAIASDPPLAIGLLDAARLLAPGTLAEEAALRREIFVVAQTGDLGKFQLLSTQYLARFRHSVYAGNFRRRFAAALTRMDFLNDPAEAGRVDDILADLDLDNRRDIYLLVARAAVNRGLTFAATFTAERALAISPPHGVDAARSRLYRAAVLVVTPTGLQAGLADLQSIDPARLPPDDAALHQAATSTAKLILTAPDLPEMTAAPARAGAVPAAAAGASVGEAPDSTVASKARRALATVDDLLTKGAR